MTDTDIFGIPMASYDVVVTLNGQDVDFGACVILMDDAIREQINSVMAGDCTSQEFLDAYCAAHTEAFGEDFNAA
jgi:hypothetical protein